MTTAIAQPTIDQAFDRLLKGEGLRRVADDLGVSSMTLDRWARAAGLRYINTPYKVGNGHKGYWIRQACAPEGTP